MIKYTCIRETNDWEGESWLIFLPYEDNLQNMVKVEILRTIINNIYSIDDESDFAIRELSYTLKEIENAKTIMDDTFDGYFNAINILRKDTLSELITIFIQIYYEMLELLKDDTWVSIQQTQSYTKLYKGAIITREF